MSMHICPICETGVDCGEKNCGYPEEQICSECTYKEFIEEAERIKPTPQIIRNTIPVN